jgi:hypothetical protein
MKIVDTKTLIRLNRKAISRDYNQTINWHGMKEDGIELRDKVIPSWPHRLQMRMWHGTDKEHSVVYRCEVLLGVFNADETEAELVRLLLDVAQDDYGALPDAKFVALMERSFPQPEIMTREEQIALLVCAGEVYHEFKRDDELDPEYQAPVADDQ